jgi:RNA polymerase sigma factor (sigma-70 family)
MAASDRPFRPRGVASFQRKREHELDRLDDEAVIAYVRDARAAGDRASAQQAIAILVHGYWRNIERRVRMKVAREHVEDVTADIIASALQSSFEGTSTGEFRAWLGTITKRRIADFHRRSKRTPTTVPLVSDPDAAGASEPAAASEEGYVEAQDVVDRMLADLSDAHRQVVDLVIFDKRTAREATQEVPGMTEDNVHQIVSRFRRALRRALEDGDTGSG